ncbi:MAG: hypothetical protein K5739_00325 [Lachnospiraceae bacterium]|nr:hypothetical protein [Lachnospiraceae bacterium]
MYSKKQRTAAMVGILLILCLIAGLVISAFLNPGGQVFYAFLFCSIACPILLWIYIWLFGKLTGKKTMADFHLGSATNDQPENTENSEDTVTISKNRHFKK